ncbi:MAG: hypothetical protein AAF805_01080 [Planctomycetota bacterium]
MTPRNQDATPQADRRQSAGDWPIDRSALRQDGERRRDAGMAAAACPKAIRVRAGQLALLDALLRSPDGMATIDDATPPDDLRAAFADGGQWRGTVPRSLAADGLIEKVAAGASLRPSRHAGARYIWRLADRTKAIVKRCRLAAAVRLALASGDDPAAAEKETPPVCPEKHPTGGVAPDSIPTNTEEPSRG